MTASNLPDDQREVVSGVVEMVKLSGLASRCFSHWLVRDILVPFFFSLLLFFSRMQTVRAAEKAVAGFKRPASRPFDMPALNFVIGKRIFNFSMIMSRSL